MIGKMWIRIWTLIALALVWAQCDTAKKMTAPKDDTQAQSLLWKIEGSDINTSYLFGTIHLIGEDSYFFTDDMQRAFDASSGLALEFDIESAMNIGAQMSMLQQAFMQGDTTLRDLVTEEEYQMVQQHFQEMGIPFFLFERVKPMFLTVFASEDMFQGGSMNMENIKSYELELVDMAKARDMSVAGLETMEYQISIFDSIPYRAQADMLIASLEADEDDGGSLDTLIYYYQKQDLPKLDALINSDPTTSTYRRVLLDNRNRNWIPVMMGLMREKPMFVAVGAGHLSGEEGVIQLLRKEGFVLTPVNTTSNVAD